ncbi:MAG: methyltransferase domain-containing protein [Chloroflexota bacterium]|nr:methyltransferase domain-containing protein [Chloroflexota bacterium]
MFENPFHIEDIQVFDDVTLRCMLEEGGFGLSVENLAWSLQGAPRSLVARIKRCLPPAQHKLFRELARQPVALEKCQAARRQVLDALFWELTYWKTPELYEELTEGEQIHPGIFQRLEPDIRGKVVLDAGAGSGRATLECLRQGAARVHAVEPSPGLLRILKQKCERQPAGSRVLPCQGRFDAIPLEDNSVDLALSCSAFTAAEEQGGDTGLAELKRVTRPGGKIVLIWTRAEDQEWLATQGFQRHVLPAPRQMGVRFRSMRSALRVARRFYARNQAVMRHLLRQREPEVPFSVLGVNPPCDYCWLIVT